MNETLTEMCKELNNWFDRGVNPQKAKYKIENGVISPEPSLLDGQYFWIKGSVFNDGVHQYHVPEEPETDPENADPETGTEDQEEETPELADEPEFDGIICGMRISPDFLKLAEEIAAWKEKNEAIDSENMSPFQSESFDIYSYSKGSSGQSTNGAASAAITWQGQFKNKLNKYRRMWGI